MPRYSIIVPVYNVEDYLRECLDSILAQDSPSEYEAILVDDGSTDNSGVICDEYVSNHRCFQVIHQENGGLSAARNSGMDAASGEYVLFLDSDDMWDPELLSAMDSFVPEAPDMTLYSCEMFDGDGHRREENLDVLPSGESGSAYMEKVFACGKIPTWSACRCMYRRVFLEENKLRFRVGSVYEDLDFSLYTFPAAKKVNGIDRAFYYYRMRAGSILHTPSKKKWVMNLEAINRWIEQHPNSATANYYCGLGIMLSDFGTRSETEDLVKRYADGADILKLVSAPKMKVAKMLYRLFGYYGGSKAFNMLLAVKHVFYTPPI